jgi:hypothetical protein
MSRKNRARPATSASARCSTAATQRKRVVISKAAVNKAARENTKASIKLSGREVPADYVRSPAVERHMGDRGSRPRLFRSSPTPTNPRTTQRMSRAASTSERCRPRAPSPHVAANRDRVLNACDDPSEHTIESAQRPDCAASGSRGDGRCPHDIQDHCLRCLFRRFDASSSDDLLYRFDGAAHVGGGFAQCCCGDVRGSGVGVSTSSVRAGAIVRARGRRGCAR